ncbi:hypothetical protein RDI58_015035 [Solanum bulbocastanum]|uniref:Uncharacterized protein n=1 Tax=Solanum bulbocastanum TaxID=147425 RepID=A0AAN8TG61_SOLBU
MHAPNQPNKETMTNEEDEAMDEQVVPQMPMGVPLSHMNPPDNNNNERRGIKHDRSTHSNSLLEESIDHRHASKYRKETSIQSSTRSEKDIHHHASLQHTQSIEVCCNTYPNCEGRACLGGRK